MLGGVIFILFGAIDIFICATQFIKAYKILFSGQDEYVLGTKFTMPFYKRMLGENSKKYLRMEKNYFQNTMKKAAVFILCAAPLALLLGIPLVYLGVRIIFEMPF